ncbi:MAG: DUF4373 domain-containing protein [Deltaproteobacteria bacterium]|nr:DUF4373 domain-containing protein [Deltaproteobacteria bacterium]
MDYFPFDVDFFDDPKIEAISGEFGSKGESITARLLCEVYRNGYYAEWSEQLMLKIAKRSNSSPDLVNQVVSRLVKWGFFNKAVFNRLEILTSRGIQARYLEATKRRKNNNTIDPDHDLININADINRINVDNNRVNVDNNPIKESKVNKSKKRKNTKKEKLDLSFLPDKYKEIWSEWLDYKRERKDPYETQRGMKAAFTHLVNLSDDNPAVAQRIIHQSIREEWKGLFELKEKKRNGFRDDKMTEAVNYLDEVMKRNNSVSNGT